MGMTFSDEMPASVLEFVINESTRAKDGYVFRPVMVSNLDNETYFVAIEKSDPDGNSIFIHAEVYDIEVHPAAPDGLVFGYRRFHEAEGPYRYGCPPTLTDLLTPSGALFTSKWKADNASFNRTTEGRGCVADAIITDLRDNAAVPSLRR